MPKNQLILYHSFDNSTTRIAIGTIYILRKGVLEILLAMYLSTLVRENKYFAIGGRGIHKLRLQDEVGSWSKNVHFV